MVLCPTQVPVFRSVLYLSLSPTTVNLSLSLFFYLSLSRLYVPFRVQYGGSQERLATAGRRRQTFHSSSPLPVGCRQGSGISTWATGAGRQWEPKKRKRLARVYISQRGSLCSLCGVVSLSQCILGCLHSVVSLCLFSLVLCSLCLCVCVHFWLPVHLLVCLIFLFCLSPCGVFEAVPVKLCACP